MPPSLVVEKINFNDRQVADRILNFFKTQAARPEAYVELKIKNGLYFQVTDAEVPGEPGWYVVLYDQLPIYVGKAGDLNNRLNTTNGSLDNFAKSTRTSDPERNFIKKLHDLKFFEELRLWFVKVKDLTNALRIEGRLHEPDLGNVEKFLNLNRGAIPFTRSSQQTKIGHGHKEG